MTSHKTYYTTVKNVKHSKSTPHPCINNTKHQVNRHGLRTNKPSRPVWAPDSLWPSWLLSSPPPEAFSLGKSPVKNVPSTSEGPSTLACGHLLESSMANGHMLPILFLGPSSEQVGHTCCSHTSIDLSSVCCQRSVCFGSTATVQCFFGVFWGSSFVVCFLNKNMLGKNDNVVTRP